MKMQIALVDMKWINTTCQRVAEAGGNVIGLVVEFHGRKMLIGTDDGKKWRAVIEFEAIEDGMEMRDAFGRTPREAMVRLLQKCSDIYTESSLVNARC